MATFYFSTSPFESSNKGSKQKFKSGDYIYGRVELSKAVKDFFDTENNDTRDYPKGILMFDFRLLDNKGTKVGEIYGNFIKPSDDELNGDSLNFDVSPEPSKASTLICMVPGFGAGLFSVPSARLFDQSNYYGRVPALVEGNVYTVEVKISRWAFDPFQPTTPKARDNWNIAMGTFELEYNSKDIQSLIKNNEASGSLVKENARLKAMANRGLPNEWNTWNGTNATGHTEKQLADMFVNGRPDGIKVHKIVIEPKPAGALWDIQRDGGNNITERHCMQLVGVFANLNGQFNFYKMGVRESYLGGDKYDVENGWMQVLNRVDVDEKFIPTGSEKKGKPEKEKKKK
jgi:hypothetical protein